MNLDFNGFDWDLWNSLKNILKHKVTNIEAEEVFHNKPKISPDHKHSHTERRYYAFGKTNNDRFLTVNFTLRTLENKILVRIISARPMNRKERKIYEKAIS